MEIFYYFKSEPCASTDHRFVAVLENGASFEWEITDL